MFDCLFFFIVMFHFSFFIFHRSPLSPRLQKIQVASSRIFLLALILWLVWTALLKQKSLQHAHLECSPLSPSLWIMNASFHTGSYTFTPSQQKHRIQREYQNSKTFGSYTTLLLPTLRNQKIKKSKVKSAPEWSILVFTIYVNYRMPLEKLRAHFRPIPVVQGQIQAPILA